MLSDSSKLLGAIAPPQTKHYPRTVMTFNGGALNRFAGNAGTETIMEGSVLIFWGNNTAAIANTKKTKTIVIRTFEIRAKKTNSCPEWWWF